MRILLTGGTVVNADGSTEADVLVDGEQIAAVGRRLAGSDVASGVVDRVIDATGKLVIPGAIDVHTHMELPFGGTFAKDTFETGTRAAAFGGTTTIIDFAVQSRGASLREGLDAWHAKAEGNACTDYGFHMIMSDVNDATLAEMDTLVAEGVTDFKLFTAYPGVFYSDDGAIFRAMQQTDKNGGLIMMHAENGMAIDVVAEQAVDARRDRPVLPRRRALPDLRGRGDQSRHSPRRGGRRAGLHRSPLGARRAGRGPRGTRPRSDGLRRDMPAVPVPLPGRHGRWVQRRQVRLLAAAAAGRPPGRPLARTGQGRPAVVSTDHCPFDFHDQKQLGVGDFRKVPNGLPGVEDRVDLMHDGGVVAGRLTRERWVEILSAAPARMFGLAGVKGVVAPGADADLVVYDPARRHTISASTHHMNVDYSCYEGREVVGGSDLVMSRGRVDRRRRRVDRRKRLGQVPAPQDRPRLPHLAG